MEEDATPKAVIGRPGGDHVRIRLTRRELPEATDYWDGNWIYADVALRAGAFRGEYEARLRSDELARFYASLGPLYDRLTGEAVLDSMEKWVRVRLAGDGKGHIAASCEAQDAPGTGNLLTFELELDQTDLPRILRELEAILAAFPVIGEP